MKRNKIINYLKSNKDFLKVKSRSLTGKKYIEIKHCSECPIYSIKKDALSLDFTKDISNFILSYGCTDIFTFLLQNICNDTSSFYKESKERNCVKRIKILKKYAFNGNFLNNE